MSKASTIKKSTLILLMLVIIIVLLETAYEHMPRGTLNHTTDNTTLWLEEQYQNYTRRMEDRGTPPPDLTTQSSPASQKLK